MVEPLSEIRKIQYRNFEKTNPPLKVRFYRTCALYVVFVLQYLRVSANGISFLSISLTFIASALFIGPGIYWGLAGVFLLYFGEMLDYCDGMMARLSKKKMVCIGVLLDDYFHQIPRQFLYPFLGLGGTLATGNNIYLALGVFTLIMQLLITHLSELRKVIVTNFSNQGVFNELDGNPLIQSSWEGLGMRLATFPFRWIKLIMLILVLLQQIDVRILYGMLFFYAPFTLLRFIAFFGHTYLKLSKLEKLDPRAQNPPELS